MESFSQYSFAIREIPQTIRSNREFVKNFLAKYGMTYDLLDTYVGIYSGDEIIGGGGYYGATIKCIAIEPEFREYGLANMIVNYLCSELWHKGLDNIFVFTKPSNKKVFAALGFTQISEAPSAILMENKKTGINNFCRNLKKNHYEGIQGAIVMNANPFTLGHQYLIQQAVKNCDHLHVFVVEEEKSVFPFIVRKHLVEMGVADFPQVTVYGGGSYIISTATFPTYFIKEPSDIVNTYAKLDIYLFAKYIAPALGITKRFVGKEPFDELTNVYNQVMKTDLPLDNIESIIIDRKKNQGMPISASMVRQFIQQNSLEAALSLVPDSTAAYLLSANAKPILDKLLSQGREKGAYPC